MALENLLIQMGRLILFKGQVAAYHGVEGDATRPDIDRVADVLAALNHFRCRVAGAATRGRKQNIVLVQVRQAEVHNLDRLAVAVQ